jgi:cAMP phosphodiesterase
MRIRALGVYGGEFPGKFTTSFLVNDRVLMDAGSVTMALSLEEQIAIRHILISHTHLDHIKGIPFLADNILGRVKEPVDLIAAPPVIEGLKKHFLNNDIWPDFTVIPSKEAPVLRWVPKKEEEPFEVDGITVEFVRTNHPVPTYGMFLTQKDVTLLYTADTGPTDRIWERAKRYPNLKGIIMEVSFPDRMKDISLLSGHLSPCMLEDELKKLGRNDVPIHLFHMKPAFERDLLKEISRLRIPRLAPLSQGESIEIR